ncbi:MAG: Unknown protein [uncultured Sulfurovum sp.]|uniref:Lipoprotein n=1 Tax=uncultured Sulfurovum sp. TaxID=269237 RepID=A0A6S6U0J0_9BACT|nr:MAG: Unknown protein [uncultured Sulfurovum sp.]
MHKKSLLFSLSGIMILTSGCYERGKINPNINTNKSKKAPKKEEIAYDFPLLKITANPTASEDNKNLASIRPTAIKEDMPVPSRQLETLPTVKPLSGITQPVPKPKLVQNDRSNTTLNTSNIVPKKQVIKKKKTSTKEKPFYLKNTLSGFTLKNIPIINTVVPKKSKINHPRIKQSIKAKAMRSSQNSPTHSRVVQRTDVPTTQMAKSDNQTYVNTSANQASQEFTGGQASDRLDMGLMQIDLHGDFTSLTLGSYEWGGYNVAPINKSPLTGLYRFKYEPYNNRIVGTIEGYKSFSSLINSQSELFNKSNLIDVIYIDRYIGKDKIKFIVELSKKVKLSITDLQDPGRIIINLYPD